MEKFEYMQLSFDDIYHTIDQMNILGKEGWELISTTKMQVSDEINHYYLLMVLKRRVRVNCIRNLWHMIT